MGWKFGPPRAAALPTPLNCRLAPTRNGPGRLRSPPVGLGIFERGEARVASRLIPAATGQERRQKVHDSQTWGQQYAIQSCQLQTIPAIPGKAVVLSASIRQAIPGSSSGQLSARHATLGIQNIPVPVYYLCGMWSVKRFSRFWTPTACQSWLGDSLSRGRNLRALSTRLRRP